LLQKEFAKTGRKIPEIGMGTYYDPIWITTAFLGWRRGAKSKVEGIKTGLENGVLFIDTAEIYRSEPLVAEAIRGMKREDLFLATKVWPNHLHRDALLRSFNNSLKRLGTSYIDLYQVHWPNPRVPIQETMSAMEQLISEGKLCYAGVSNFNLQQLEQAQSALPKSELASDQLDYSLVHRNVEEDILPHCDKEGIALLAYYPLGHGKLVSDTRLDPMSTKRGKTPAQVALRWLAEKPNVFPIPRASKLSHVIDNAGASDWGLSDQDMTELNQRFQ
jgi:diketogulonate reductase-like aldo/keto reductase